MFLLERGNEGKGRMEQHPKPTSLGYVGSVIVQLCAGVSRGKDLSPTSLSACQNNSNQFSYHRICFWGRSPTVTGN